MMDTYRVVTYREEGFWTVEIPELDLLTQARRLDGVERMARSIISLHLGVDRDSFDVAVEPKLEDEVARRIDRARRLRDEARVMAEQAARLWARSAHDLHEQGLPYRDVGQVLGVSFQRAKQLVDEASAAPSMPQQPARRGHRAREQRRLARLHERDKVDA